MSGTCAVRATLPFADLLWLFFILSEAYLIKFLGNCTRPVDFEYSSNIGVAPGHVKIVLQCIDSELRRTRSQSLPTVIRHSGPWHE